MSSFEFWHHHLGISVPDLEASIQWYGEKLGFKLEKRFRIEAIPASCAFIRNGSLRIELFMPDHPKPLPAERRAPDTDNLTHGNKHCAFIVPDVPALYAEFVKRGIDIVWIKKMPDGGAVFIRDNSGIILEFVQGTPAAPEPGVI
jgi:catechol 2,3-dioxygenase-like lactoylglutathione lyase family enzyme